MFFLLTVITNNILQRNFRFKTLSIFRSIEFRFIFIFIFICIEYRFNARSERKTFEIRAIVIKFFARKSIFKIIITFELIQKIYFLQFMFYINIIFNQFIINFNIV